MSDGAGRQFLRATKYQFLKPSPQSLGEPQPPLELPVGAGLARIDLPTPNALDLEPVDLRDVIEARTTIRNYARQPLMLEELAFLLWATQGVKALRGTYATLRTVPSAGAVHAFETYLLVNAVTGLEPGMYRYLAIDHQLVKLDMGDDLTARVTKACRNQEQVARSGVTFIWVVVAERMTWRYVERGYRYLHLDAGHVCQNLYLAAQVTNCGVCALAAFDDDRLNALLGIDGESQFAIYAATVGRRR